MQGPAGSVSRVRLQKFLRSPLPTQMVENMRRIVLYCVEELFIGCFAHGLERANIFRTETGADGFADERL